MLLLLCATLARAADPEASSATEDPVPQPAAEVPAEPKPSPPIFDVVVVKKGTTVPAPAAQAAAAPAAGSAPIFDVSVVRPAGDITPPPLPRGGDITPPPDPAPPPSPLPASSWAAAAELEPPPPPKPEPPPLAPPVGTEAPPEAVAQWEQPQSAAAKWAAAVATPRVVTPPANALGEGAASAASGATAPSVGEGPNSAGSTASGAPPGVGLTITEGDDWTVTDASGRKYDTVQFARLVGDRETLRKLQNQRDFLQIGSTSLAIGGGALLIASLVVIAGAGGAPDILDYSVDPADYDNEESYVAATEFSSEQYEKAVDSWQSQKAGSAVFLAGSGALLLGSAPFLGRERPNEERPPRVYARDDAQRWAEQYNTNNPPPPGSLPAPTAPAPPVESEGTESAAPPAEEGPAPTPAEPTPANPLNEGVPSESEFDDNEPPGLRVRPLVGPGMLGVTGSF